MTNPEKQSVQSLKVLLRNPGVLGLADKQHKIV